MRILLISLCVLVMASGCEQKAGQVSRNESSPAPTLSSSKEKPAEPPTPAAATPSPSWSKPTVSAQHFTPPPESDIPNDAFGEMVKLGKNIFVDTQQYAKGYVGNGMNCANCHLDNGRRADSAPLWGAYVLYPAFRKKTGRVDTMVDRIQGCFRFSMNGRPPAPDSKEMTALITYHYWLAKGAPTGVKLPGQGYLSLPKPAQAPDLQRGAQIYRANCALCHGDNGEGTKASGGGYAFPPLWGKDSFNWGAGMHRVDTAAGFIKANMPYGRGGMLSDQESWDVAFYMNSHERPEDPRRKGSIAQTRDEFHQENCLYGRPPAELAATLTAGAAKQPSLAKPQPAP